MATESTEEHGKSSWEVLIKSLSVIPEQTGIQNINSLDPGLRRGDNLVSVSLMLLFLSVDSVAIRSIFIKLKLLH